MSMENENNLDRLFERARNAQPETSVSEVESWIRAAADAPKSKTKKTFQLTKFFNLNTIIVMSVLTTLLTSVLLVLMPGTPRTFPEHPAHPQAASSNAIKVTSAHTTAMAPGAASETALPMASNANGPSLKSPVWEKPQHAADNVWAMASTGSGIPAAESFGYPALETEATPSEHTSPAPEFPKDATPRTWVSRNDFLAVDTLFGRVKKIVYSSKSSLDLRVTGSNRTDVGLSVFYQRTTKGKFIRIPRKHELRLSYFIKDSVLYVNVEENHHVTVGIAVQENNSNNRIVFSVPHSIEVDVNTGYSDVAMEHLNGTAYTVACSYGDIKLLDVRGKLNLNSAYGDITMEKMNGDMRVKSKYGDVKLQDLARNHYSIESTYGDIQAKSSEGDLEFSSSYGDLRLGSVQGNISIKTLHGDVRASNLQVQNQLNIATTYGDIDCQVAHPTSELQFDLSAGNGDVRVRRDDLRTEESRSLRSGNGSRKLTVKSNYGDIIIR